ncbi:MAG: metal ABC transporter ATP-binding protein [Desulfovibrio sp.]|nr:metal ABC transporter ATP-binding protein [Desulfovibrio sp.]
MVSNNSACPAVKFDCVHVCIGQTCLLDNVCAAVPPGGATVLAGPNGAGKTTLLHCLIGKVAYRGTISVTNGKNGISPRIGYVPQRMSVDENMPLLVGEFLSMHLQRRPLWLGRAKRARQRAGELLSMTGAEALEKQRMGSLSGGELRRVLLSAALSGDPELLLLDEPAAGVDVRGENLFWEMLEAVRRKRNFTQLVVSHNLSLVAHYATHVICLNKNVISEGSPRETLTVATLTNLFGMPIHLYPDQCEISDEVCPQCGALTGESSHV